MQLPYDGNSTFGKRFYPPFVVEQDVDMLESYPSFFVIVAHFMQPATILDDTIPKDKQIQIVTGVNQGVTTFLGQEQILKDFLPRSIEKAKRLQFIVGRFFNAFSGAPGPHPTIDVLKTSVDGFFITLQDEMDRLCSFTATEKGNLSVKSLAAGASKQYPKATRELLDDFIINEIDHAGKCLAFELPTACGFHILRAVEVTAKAYVHAATGQLPPIKNRNWGEYIVQLEKAGAHSDVIDMLRVLKTKRNPLMHPQDNLEIDDGITLLCICQSAIDTIAGDLKRRNLEVKFKESLKVLPTL